MNELYEYIDVLTSPYEAFCFDTARDTLPIPAHWHYYVELLYILEGSVKITIDNTVVVCSEGAVVLFPPRCMHAIDYCHASAHICYDVIKFDPSVLTISRKDDLDLRSVLHSTSSATLPCCFAAEQISAMNLSPLFAEVIREHTGQEYGHTMIINANIRKIIVAFVRIWHKEGYTLPVSPVQPAYELSFDMVAEYIDKHYFEDLKSTELAAMCHMGHSTFSMNFRRRYGITCKEYITTIRINVAENMLLFSNHNIAFIAQEVGYSDCSYFIRCYKKIKGITPSQARGMMHTDSLIFAFSPASCNSLPQPAK